MTDIRMRPRVSVTVSDPQRVLDILEERTTDRDDFTLKRFADHAVLSTRSQHLWSPQLAIDVETNAEDQPIYGLSGRFEPSSNIWSLFMAAYAISGFGGFLSLCWGLGQWLAGQPPHALWGALVGTLLVTNTYAFSLFGRALGFDDMYRLRSEFEHAVDIAERSVH